MSDEAWIRSQVRSLTVATCVYLSVRDWRSRYAGGRGWLAHVGLADPGPSDLQLFASLVWRKALVGTLLAVLIVGGWIVLFRVLKLPPFS